MLVIIVSEISFLGRDRLQPISKKPQLATLIIVGGSGAFDPKSWDSATIDSVETPFAGSNNTERSSLPYRLRD